MHLVCHCLQALYRQWVDIGVKMGIKDIPATYDEFERFNVQYEKDKMVYADS